MDEAGQRPEGRVRAGGDLAELVRAFHAHSDEHHRPPPPEIRAPDGEPLLSWRVALLPYVGQKKLYEEFKLDEAWDGPRSARPLSPS